jgi:hypothetical protein
VRDDDFPHLNAYQGRHPDGPLAIAVIDPIKYLMEFAPIAAETQDLDLVRSVFAESRRNAGKEATNFLGFVERQTLADLPRDVQHYVAGCRAINVGMAKLIHAAIEQSYTPEWMKHTVDRTTPIIQRGKRQGKRLPHVFPSPNGDFDLVMVDEDGRITDIRLAEDVIRTEPFLRFKVDEDGSYSFALNDEFLRLAEHHHTFGLRHPEWWRQLLLSEELRQTFRTGRSPGCPFVGWTRRTILGQELECGDGCVIRNTFGGNACPH